MNFEVKHLFTTWFLDQKFSIYQSRTSKSANEERNRDMNKKPEPYTRASDLEASDYNYLDFLHLQYGIVYSELVL